MELLDQFQMLVYFTIIIKKAKNPPSEAYLGFLGQLASYRVYLF